MRIYRRCSIIAITLFVGSSVFGQQPGTGVALRGNRGEVEARYREIAESTSLHDRKEIFKTLSQEMKTDLWLMNLQSFMSHHPELSPAQRDVIVEGIGILAADLPGGLDGIALHDEDGRMQRFSAHAIASLPRELFLEAFAQIGSRSNLISPKTDRGDRRIAVDSPPPCNRVDCNCSHTDNFCDQITNPLPVCKTGCCLLMSGCGWWWMETCNGVCSADV